MNCPECGAEIAAEEAAFCPECGQGLKGAGEKRPAAEEKKESDAGAKPAAVSEAFTMPEPARARAEPPVREAPPPERQARPGGPPAPEPRPPNVSACPVTLELNAAKIYVEGMQGIIEMRVLNPGGEVLPKVVIDVRSDYVSRLGQRVVKDLAPGERSRKLQTQLSLPERSAGESLVSFDVKVERLDAPSAYCGEAAVLVLPPGTSPQNFVLNVQGAQISAGSKGMMGAYVNAPLHLQEAIEAGRIETAADYLRASASVEPEWRAVELYPDEERTEGLRRGGAKLVARRARGGRADFRLRLDVSAPAGDGRVLLLSQKEVTFGRSRRACDLSLVLLPITLENRGLSKQISGHFDRRTTEGTPPHMTLKLAGSGAELVDQSKFGTFLDGALLGAGASRPLTRESKVGLAEVLDLEMRTYALGEEFDRRDYVALARGGVFDECVRSRVAAVRIRRTSNLTEESYLLVYAGVSVGSSPDAGVPLEGSGLEPRHLLILQLGDGFYVENVSGSPEGARFNGNVLDPDRLEPIRPGDSVELGTVTIRVGEFEQLRPGT